MRTFPLGLPEGFLEGTGDGDHFAPTPDDINTSRVDEELERELEAERLEVELELNPPPPPPPAAGGGGDVALVNDTDLPGSPFVLRPAADPTSPPRMSLDPATRGSKKSRLKGKGKGRKKKSPSKPGPASLRLSDAERAAACRTLRRKTQFELPLCDHAMRNAGDDEAKAEEWLRGLSWRKEYRSWKVLDVGAYGEVLEGLGFEFTDTEASGEIEGGRQEEGGLVETLCASLVDDGEGPTTRTGSYLKAFEELEGGKGDRGGGGSEKDLQDEESIFETKVLKR